MKRKDIRNAILNGFKYFPDHPSRRLEFVYHGKREYDMMELIGILSGLSLSRLELDGVRISGTIDLSSRHSKLKHLSIVNSYIHEKLDITLLPSLETLTIGHNEEKTTIKLKDGV